jgi:SAM-dependent methyltransferase
MRSPCEPKQDCFVDTGRQAIERNRNLWALVNERFTDTDADVRWTASGITWGLFQHREAELGLLGDVAGLDVVELGCGTAYLAAALARAGARPVAVDLSPAQLDTARRCQLRHGTSFPLVEANGEQLPLKDRSFDLVVSEYGAGPWCDPSRWLAEAARVLRPGGRLVFLTHSVLVAMCVPEDAGPAGDRLLRGQRAMSPIAWPGGGVEHHPGHGDWINLLRAAGFVVDALHELYASADAGQHEYYDIVDGAWASRWPAEDVWVAHLEPVGPQRER